MWTGAKRPSIPRSKKEKELDLKEGRAMALKPSLTLEQPREHLKAANAWVRPKNN